MSSKNHRAGKFSKPNTLVWPTLGFAAFLPTALAFVDGPPAASTGGFGEPTCHRCHFDAPPNDAIGGLTVQGLPMRYQPGDRYLLTVEITRPGATLTGFQLAIRHTEGQQAGAQAGRLEAAGAQVQVVSGAPRNAVQYAEHSEAGAHTARRRSDWRVTWEAPRNGGAVVLHVAGTAANGDDSPLGDFVYFREARSASGPAAPGSP